MPNSEAIKKYDLEHEKAKQEYDRLVRELNIATHERDNAWPESEKKLAQKKCDALGKKLADADRKEQAAQRRLDDARRG